MATDYTMPPQVADSEAYLRAAGYWPYDSLAPELADIARSQLEVALAAMTETFENATGWLPFVASKDPDAVNETRYFDSAEVNGVLLLEAGLLQLTDVSIAGQSLVLNQNVWLQPANARNMNRPYTALRLGAYSMGMNGFGAFNSSPMMRPNQIAVTGLWGRSTEWPADAWDSIRKLACVAPLSQLNPDQQLQNWSEDGFSESFDVASTIRPVLLWTNWQKEFDALILRYMRVTC